VTLGGARGGAPRNSQWLGPAVAAAAAAAVAAAAGTGVGAPNRAEQDPGGARECAGRQAGG
jgi:hypothetical protein